MKASLSLLVQPVYVDIILASMGHLVSSRREPGEPLEDVLCQAPGQDCLHTEAHTGQGNLLVLVTLIRSLDQTCDVPMMMIISTKYNC